MVGSGSAQDRIYNNVAPDNQRAQFIMNQEIRAGRGGNFAGSGIVGDNTPQAKAEQKNKDTFRSYLLHTQLTQIAENIAHLKDLMEQYDIAINNLGETIDSFDVAIAAAPAIQAMLERYPGHTGLNKLIKERYEEFSATEGTLFEAMENNALRHEGELVYMDEQGLLYTLGENHERQMIENERVQLELYNQIYAQDPPAIPANKLWLGKDPTNNIHHTHNQLFDFSGLDVELGVDKTEIIASVEPSEDGFITCDYVGGLAEVCTAAKDELQITREEHQEQARQLEEEIQKLEDKLEAAKADDLSKEEITALEEEVALKQDELETNIQAIEDLDAFANDPHRSLSGGLAISLNNPGMDGESFNVTGMDSQPPIILSSTYQQGDLSQAYNAQSGAAPGSDLAATSAQSDTDELPTPSPEWDPELQEYANLKKLLLSEIAHNTALSHDQLASLADEYGIKPKHMERLRTDLEHENIKIIDEPTASSDLNSRQSGLSSYAAADNTGITGVTTEGFNAVAQPGGPDPAPAYDIGQPGPAQTAQFHYNSGNMG